MFLNCDFLLYADPLPLKKRHLKKFQTMSSEPAKLTTAVASECRGNEPCCDEPLIVSSPVALEQQVQIVLADSVNDLQPHKQETRLGTELLSLREGKLVRPHTTAALSSVDSNVLTANTQTAGNGVSTTSMTISLWRPSDPRLVNISPVSSTYPPILPPSSGVAPVVNVTSPVSASLPSQSVSLFPQGSDYSSGTPGKKKVSKLMLLLCFWFVSPRRLAGVVYILLPLKICLCLLSLLMLSY